MHKIDIIRLCKLKCLMFCIFRAVQVLRKRQLLDRRRLEDAHLKFACLQIAKWYPQSFKHHNLVFTPSLNETLQKLTPVYHEAFLGFYSSKICLKCGCINRF